MIKCSHLKEKKKGEKKKEIFYTQKHMFNAHNGLSVKLMNKTALSIPIGLMSHWGKVAHHKVELMFLEKKI